MPRRKFTMESDGSSKISAMPADALCENKLVFARRLTMLRSRAGLSKKDLADALGLCPGAIHNWESGRTRPDIANIPAICKVLRIPISEFFNDVTATADISREDLDLLQSLHNLTEPHRIYVRKMIDELCALETAYVMQPKLRTDLVRIPFAGAALAAGTGTPDETGVFDGSLYLYSDSFARRADFAFRVNGESMEPDYHSGDIVYVQKTGFDAIRPGDICAFETDGMLYIKEYRRDGLYSRNKAYPPMYFRDYEEIRIIGRVLGIVDQADCAEPDEIRLFLQNERR